MNNLDINAPEFPKPLKYKLPQPIEEIPEFKPSNQKPVRQQMPLNSKQINTMLDTQSARQHHSAQMHYPLLAMSVSRSMSYSKKAIQPDSLSRLLLRQPTLPKVLRLNDQIVQNWILDLNDENRRGDALIELMKRKDKIPDLAMYLWHGFGVIVALMQEITSAYIDLDPPTLSNEKSTRVGNTLGLICILVQHNETRPHFLKSRLQLYLYPFLSSTSKSPEFENLRCVSLGVIAALLKTDDPVVIPYLLQNDNSEIIPMCLTLMQSGSIKIQSVAVFIIEKILLHDSGLQYLCHTPSRILEVTKSLNKVVESSLVELERTTDHINYAATGHRIRHIKQCFNRMSEHPNAHHLVNRVVHPRLSDGTFYQLLRSI